MTIENCEFDGPMVFFAVVPDAFMTGAAAARPAPASGTEESPPAGVVEAAALPSNDRWSF
jgi:hypothetical protein